jgi:hypothetical protein
MLKSPARPRAPSAATLRVLYQLAYISSGTAVGIGALCAEERRRRTQLVQKIADNAKRIRSSPRYAHGSAAAAVKEDNFGWSGNESESGPTRPADVTRAKARKVENHEGAKMPELPSVVEEEYGRLIEGNRTANGKRSGIKRPNFVEEHGNREALGKPESEGPVEQRPQIRTSSKLWVPSRPTTSHVEHPKEKVNLKNVKKTPLEWQSSTRLLRYVVMLGGGVQTTSCRKQLFHATEANREHTKPHQDYDAIAKLFFTHRRWAGKRNTERGILPKTLARDVNLFFEKVDADYLPHMSTEHANRIADELLHLSLDIGLVKQTRSLLLWKIAVRLLSTEDILCVATSFRGIAESVGSEDTIQFFADLLATRTYEEAPFKVKFGITLRLHAEALKMDTLDESTEMHEQLTGSIALAIPPNTRRDLVAELLEPECRRLIQSDHLPSAVKLWCITMKGRRYHHDPSRSLDTELLRAAIAARHLSLSAQMLRIRDFAAQLGKRSKAMLEYLREYNRQKDALIQICCEEGAVGMLQSLLDSGSAGGLKHLSPHLSPQSYVYLCRCFADTNARFQMFERYYALLPPKYRASLAEFSIADAAFALKADWKATHNLDLVRERYEHALTAVAVRTEADTRPLKLAMIEIALSANQPVEAIQSLSILNESGTDGSIATLTALALAKQKNWLAFGRLFETLKHDRPTWNWTPTMKRAYNNALHLFSRSHTAQQLSDFVSMSINELRLRPNQSTWEVLLSSLVSKKSVTLLKYWMSLSLTSENKLNWNVEIAATLMKTWYLNFRQSHVLVIWLCRNLVRAAPSLQGNALLDVARETIGYDLRTLHGVNAPWMEPIIRARAAVYQNADGRFPKPGYVVDGRLYDRGQLVTIDGTSAKGPVPHAEIALPSPHAPQPATTLHEAGTESTAETGDPLEGVRKDDRIHGDSDSSAAVEGSQTKDALTHVPEPQTATTSQEAGAGSKMEKWVPYGVPDKDVRARSVAEISKAVEASEISFVSDITAQQEGDVNTTSASVTTQSGTSLADLLGHPDTTSASAITQPSADLANVPDDTSTTPASAITQPSADLANVPDDTSTTSTSASAITQAGLPGTNQADILGDASATSASVITRTGTNLADLRPSYETYLSSGHDSDMTTDMHDSKMHDSEVHDSDMHESDIQEPEMTESENLERRMVLQFGLRHYEVVLKLYQESLDAVGLPASPMVLEIAVEASLRSNDDRQEAENIISAAREAGMNVTCAMGPLIIDQISRIPLIDVEGVAALRDDVFEYYRVNELNGLHVKHHVATKAAHALIEAGYAQDGISLLSTISGSSWVEEKPLDIVAMSVWLSGYAVLGHVKGMHWAVAHVLHQKLGIDKGFLRALARARRPTQRVADGSLIYQKQAPKALAYLRQWYIVCSRRHLAQMQESKVFGRKLVALLASAANRGVARTAAPRAWPRARARRRRGRLIRKDQPEPALVEPALVEPTVLSPVEPATLVSWSPMPLAASS